MRLEDWVLNFSLTIELVEHFHVKRGLLMDGTGGKSSTGPCTANRCFFVSWKTSRTNSEVFPWKAIGIAVVMETPSGYGGS